MYTYRRFLLSRRYFFKCRIAYRIEHRQGREYSREAQIVIVRSSRLSPSKTTVSRRTRTNRREGNRAGLTTDFGSSSTPAFYWSRATFRGNYGDTFAAYWQRRASRITGVIVVSRHNAARSSYGSRPTCFPVFAAMAIV